MESQRCGPIESLSMILRVMRGISTLLLGSDCTHGRGHSSASTETTPATYLKIQSQHGPLSCSPRRHLFTTYQRTLRPVGFIHRVIQPLGLVNEVLVARFLRSREPIDSSMELRARRKAAVRHGPGEISIMAGRQCLRPMCFISVCQTYRLQRAFTSDHSNQSPL